MSSIIKVDQIQLSDGSTPTAGDLGITGSTIQVIGNSYTDITTASADSYTRISGLSTSITPTSASSKIVVILGCSICGDVDGDGSTSTGYVRIQRDSSTLKESGQVLAARGGQTRFGAIDFNFVDTPNTTSQITYHFDVRKSGGPNIAINSTTFAHMTLLEIAG
jgi:hypothetical protein